MTAVAELSEPADFDRWLSALPEALHRRGLVATLEKESREANAAADGLTLHAPSLGGRAEVVLSRRGKTLVYGVGKNAFTNATAKLTTNTGLPSTGSAFSPLFAEDTSGVIVDLTRAMPLLRQAPEVLFGGKNQLLHTFFGRMLQSFAHLTDIGLTLSFEGPAYEPHPTVRAWIDTK